jgi:crossover junction endodeoxyribonuclease RuvC
MTRILSFDTSLGAPGVALVEFKKGRNGAVQAKIIDKSHIKTDGKQSLTLRAEIVEAWATLFIAKHVKKGFDYIYREDFQGMSSHQNYPVFSAWAATERAVHKHDHEFDKFVYYDSKGKRKIGHGISQSRAKMLVVGKGNKVSKDDTEEAVRKLTGFDGTFEKDDESDACCIALACGIQLGLFPDVHGKLNKYDRANQEAIV